MTEKRFTVDYDIIVGTYCLHDDLKSEGVDGYIAYLNSEKQANKLCGLLNEQHEENEHYKAMFYEIVENALTDKNCRELYCKGILNIFDKANSLNQAREMIKEHME